MLPCLIITGSCAGVSLVDVIVPIGDGGRLRVVSRLAESVIGCCAKHAREKPIATKVARRFIPECDGRMKLIFQPLNQH